MKRATIAIAVLAVLGSSAQAQSTVTLYGKIDLGMVMDSGNPGGKSIRLSSGVTGGSRIGFKGVEDLGGGYKAAFQIETGFCADSAAGAPNFCTGSNQFMGRQAHGDLSGPFGNLSAGRQYSIGFNNLVVLDPFGTGFAGNINNLVDGNGFRLNNSVTYTTPSFSGLTASAEFALGEQTGAWRDNRETGAGVTYVSGPTYVSFTYYGVANPNGQGLARRDYLLGGTYDFGVLKLHLMGEKSNGDPTGAPVLDTTDLMAGLTVPIGNGVVLLSYIRHDDRGVLNHDAQQLAAGYQYRLSKRTSIYTAFARIQNEHGATFKVGNATEAGTGNKAFNLGVVHNF